MTSEQLPEIWVRGGAQSAAEEEAAALLRRAFGEMETPSPAVGARIRRGLDEKLDAPPRIHRPGRALAIGVGLAVAAAAMIVVLLPPPANRTLVRGELTATGGGRSGLEALRTSEAVACRSAWCELDLHHTVRAVLQHRTIMRVSSPAGGELREVELQQGVATFEVEPLEKGKGFAVQAHDTRVEVVGTAFQVEAPTEGRVRVSVSEGTVRVTHRGQVTYVRAGESWSEPAVAQEAAGAASPIPAPALVEPAVASTAAAPVARVVEAVEDPSALLRRAAAFAEAGALDRARELYRELSRRSGPSGELGLYYLAQFELRRLHAPARARAILAEMAERYSQGHLVVERHIMEIETHLAMRECSAARQRTAEFEEQFPGSRSMLGELRPMMEAAGCTL